jgi:hypothetical protein
MNRSDDRLALVRERQLIDLIGRLDSALEAVECADLFSQERSLIEGAIAAAVAFLDNLRLGGAR